jgi:hypothetical protein
MLPCPQTSNLDLAAITRIPADRDRKIYQIWYLGSFRWVAGGALKIGTCHQRGWSAAKSRASSLWRVGTPTEQLPHARDRDLNAAGEQARSARMVKPDAKDTEAPRRVEPRGLDPLARDSSAHACMSRRPKPSGLLWAQLENARTRAGSVTGLSRGSGPVFLIAPERCGACSPPPLRSRRCSMTVCGPR